MPISAFLIETPWRTGMHVHVLLQRHSRVLAGSASRPRRPFCSRLKHGCPGHCMFGHRFYIEAKVHCFRKVPNFANFLPSSVTLHSLPAHFQLSSFPRFVCCKSPNGILRITPYHVSNPLVEEERYIDFSSVSRMHRSTSCQRRGQKQQGRTKGCHNRRVQLPIQSKLRRRFGLVLLEQTALADPVSMTKGERIRRRAAKEGLQTTMFRLS
jgi:hypothetical protein